jgi:hypothetical protein
MHLERHQSSVNEFHLITWHGVKHEKEQNINRL